MALHIIDEADRCLNCKKPLCRQGCPINTPIPQVIQLFKDRRIEEAGQILFENNPMSLVCSLVCNHGDQCEGHCVRGRKGTPIHFSAIESYLSDTYLDRMKPSRPEPAGKKAAVIGAGPAGITVAFKLVEAGCDVTIFEKRPQVGGMLEYGIPEFRLPRSIIPRYRELLCEMGVRIRPDTTIGGALHIEDLLRDGYDAVFCGTGTWRAKTLGIQGESRGSVYFGIDYLISPETCHVGRDVAVIGVGNVAMDVARTALRHGARHVTLYARSGHDVSARSDEVEYALLDGAEIVYGKSIESIGETGPVFRTSILDDEGNITGYEDELDHVECDTTIIAVSQVPKNKLLLTTQGLEGTERGLLKVGDDCMTTVPGVFAAGDVVTGGKTVVHATAQAKRAAEGMLSYMGLDCKK
jgi:glutamate synthase (NADPH/NADH) small chain